MSWVLLNLWADFGLTFASHVTFSHANWALQTSDLYLNMLELVMIAYAQFLKFSYALFRVEPESRFISKGKHFNLALTIFSLVFGALLWRLSFVDSRTYPPLCPNAMVFMAEWIFWSIVGFAGYTGFWRYALFRVAQTLRRRTQGANT